MRTTVTLDPDTERLLRETMQKRGVSFKQALNDAVRAGSRRRHRVARPFVQKSFRMGPEQLFRWDKALALSDAIEEEEIGRKLSLRR
jgi:hypothetical protein